MPEEARIIRVLNNNAVLVARDGVELVLASRGIGFSKTQGDAVVIDSVPRKYVETSIDKVEFLKSLSSLDPQLFDTVARAVEMATELLTDLHPSIYVALTDHLSYAVQRMKDGLSIENGLLDEIRAAFPAEFAAAVEIVRYVNTQLDVELPLDEAAFIALHLNAARTGSSVKRPLQEANELSQLIELITSEFGIKDVSPFSNQEVLSYLLRLIDRLSAQRSRHNKATHQIAQALPHEMSVARRITHKIADTHHVSVSEDEAALLAVFLHGWLQGDGTPHER